MGDLIQFPGVKMDNKTATDERALFEQFIAIQTGKDGVEAGLSTTEFWLTATAVAIDVLGPHYGFLQGLDASEQGVIAMALVLGYGALRTWRKNGGPAKALAVLAAGLGKAPQPPTQPVEAPKAA